MDSGYRNLRPWGNRPEAIPTIMELLNDKDPMIQQAAAISLGNMGPKAKAAVPALTKLLKDKNPLVR